MGVEGSCQVSKEVMDAWDLKVIEVEEISPDLSTINPVQYDPLKTYLLRKIVDIVLTSLKKMKLGVIWEPQHKCCMWYKE